MILSVWVLFIIGDPFAGEHGTPYVQHIVPAAVHDTSWRREEFESLAEAEFRSKYPGHVVADSGWTRQQVSVNGG
jgi:hypothetical protein